MNILFVCTGNTCRSPMAEGYLNSLKKEDYTAKSCGLAADGSPVSENSKLSMSEKGIDISGHISRQITLDDISWADKIYCMTESHKSYLEPYAKEKLCVLGGGIIDPFGGDINVYRLCRDNIFAAVDKIVSVADYEIIPIEREHIKQVAALEEVCFTDNWSERTILESFMAGTRFFVAVRQKAVLGYVGVSCILDEGYITNVAVFPEERGKGIATALLNRVFTLAEEKGLSFVSLEVRESNSVAISIYDKLGFKVEGKRRDFYTNPKEDALIMTKRFVNE